MKIVFFWTPEFAAHILLGLLKFPEIDCQLVVSQSDKIIGRKKELSFTPVKNIAKNHNLNVLQPEKIKNNQDFFEVLRKIKPDFIVVAAYGKIIPKQILDIPQYGCINIHGSILPKFRWASPVQAAIKNGETETWLTIMYMSEAMDEGDILQIARIPVDNGDTSIDIFKKFVDIGPNLLIQTLKNIIRWGIISIRQNNEEATFCWKISRKDGEIFFQKQSAQDIYNTFRAYISWPGVFTFFEEKRIVLDVVSLTHEKWKTPGEFIKIGNKKFGIVCSDHSVLELQEIKLAWKKATNIMSFINGNKNVIWYKFK